VFNVRVKWIHSRDYEHRNLTNFLKIYFLSVFLYMWFSQVIHVFKRRDGLQRIISYTVQLGIFYLYSYPSLLYKKLCISCFQKVTLSSKDFGINYVAYVEPRTKTQIYRRQVLYGFRSFRKKKCRAFTKHLLN
jgi:hypothetical protein